MSHLWLQRPKEVQKVVLREKQAEGFLKETKLAGSTATQQIKRNYESPTHKQTEDGCRSQLKATIRTKLREARSKEEW